MKFLLNLLKQSGSGEPAGYVIGKLEISKTGCFVLGFLLGALVTFVFMKVIDHIKKELNNDTHKKDKDQDKNM